MNNRLGVIGLVSVLTQVLGPVGTAHSSHLYDQANVITWNLCNGYSAPCGHQGSNDPAKSLKAFIIGSPRKPFAVATQEMCLASWEYLQENLAYLGYQSAVYWSNPSTGSACEKHGNGIFWVGGCYSGSSSSCTASAVYNNQASEADSRGWVCGRAAWPSFVACSTHLTHKSDSTAGLQATEYYNILQYLNGLGTKTLGSGDFNVNAIHSALNNLYLNYDEADGCGSDCGRATWAEWGNQANNEKIDDIWVPESSMCVLHSAYISDVSQSDHHRYQGYVGTC